MYIEIMALIKKFFRKYQHIIDTGGKVPDDLIDLREQILVQPCLRLVGDRRKTG